MTRRPIRTDRMPLAQRRRHGPHVRSIPHGDYSPLASNTPGVNIDYVMRIDKVISSYRSAYDVDYIDYKGFNTSYELHYRADTLSYGLNFAHRKYLEGAPSLTRSPLTKLTVDIFRSDSRMTYTRYGPIRAWGQV